MKNIRKQNLTPEEKKKRRNSLLRSTGILTALFGVTTTIVYFALPNGPKATDEGDDSTSSTSKSTYTDGDDEDPLTPVDHFYANLTGMKALSASFELSAALPKHQFALNGSLKLSIPASINDIAFNLATNIAYNSVDVKVAGTSNDTLDVDYVNKNLYLSVMGMNYKVSHTETDEMMTNLAQIFGQENVENFLTIDESQISSLTKGTDTSKFTDAIKNMTSEKLNDGTYKYTLTIDSNVIYLTANAKYDFTGAWGSFSFTPTNSKDAINLSFALKNVNIEDNVLILDPEIDSGKSYLEVNKSLGIVDKIYKLYQASDTGIDIKATIKNGKAVDTITGSANVNWAEKYHYDLALKSDYAFGTDNASLTTQTIAAAYTPEAVYMDYNTGALKAKLSYSAMSTLIQNVKDSLGSTASQTSSKAFDFITESEVVKGITDGHYEACISLIKKIETANNQMKFTIDLTKFGFSSGELAITIDGNASTSETPTQLGQIAISNLSLSSDVVIESATFTTSDYAPATVTPADYMSLDFAPTVYNQFYALFDSKKIGARIDSATLLETGTTNKLTVDSGSLQVDVTNKIGTGSLKMTQTKADWGDGVSLKHDVTADMTTDKLLFSYSNEEDSSPLNGTLKVSSLTDIINQVKSLTDDADPRYSKFFQPIKDKMAETIIGRLVRQDYGALLEQKVLKSVTTEANATSGLSELKFVIDGALIGNSGHDVVVYLPLTAADKVQGLRLENFVYDKYTIDASITLIDYNDAKVAQLTEDSTFMTFDGLKTLVKFGIKTSRLTTYHLTATANFGFTDSSLINLGADLDFYLYVVEKTVKVSGYITGIPLNVLANTSWVPGGSRDVTFFYEPPANGLTGGNIYLKAVNTYNLRPFHKTDTTYSKEYAPYVVENILTFLCDDILSLHSSYVSSIKDKTTTSGKQPIVIENVLNSFSSTESTDGSATWTLSLNLGVLANNTTLKNLDVTLGGNTDGYLASADIKMGIDFFSACLTASAKVIDIGSDCWTGESFKAKAADAWAAGISRTSFDVTKGY